MLYYTKEFIFTCIATVIMSQLRTNDILLSTYQEQLFKGLDILKWSVWKTKLLKCIFWFKFPTLNINPIAQHSIIKAFNQNIKLGILKKPLNVILILFLIPIQAYCYSHCEECLIQFDTNFANYDTLQLIILLYRIAS